MFLSGGSKTDKTEYLLFFAACNRLKKLCFLLIFTNSIGLAAQSVSIRAILEATVKSNIPQKHKSAFQIIEIIYFFV